MAHAVYTHALRVSLPLYAHSNRSSHCPGFCSLITLKAESYLPITAFTETTTNDPELITWESASPEVDSISALSYLLHRSPTPVPTMQVKFNVQELIMLKPQKPLQFAVRWRGTCCVPPHNRVAAAVIDPRPPLSLALCGHWLYP